MKLIDITEKEKKKGTYAASRFSESSKKVIAKYVKDNDIPSSPKADALHITILYSRKYLPDYEPEGTYETPLEVKPIGFDIWETQADDNGDTKNALVLKLDSPDLIKRQKYLMDEHGATFDFDEYNPHVTFSYDVGDKKVKDLPKFEEPLEIVEEYGEDLNLDWASDNT